MEKNLDPSSDLKYRNKYTLDDFESLFVNNPDLDSIGDYVSKFNPIKVMGMTRMEIRHSAILAWLLNPKETHGLGDRFLKAFISEALRDHNAEMLPSALQVSQADMTDTEVRREWRQIDILLISPRNGWIFIIENKVDSRQRKNQLKDYFELVESVFDSHQPSLKRGIFLTLWDEAPQDDRYAPIQYGAVCGILEQLSRPSLHALKHEVATFVDHYLEVVKEIVGMSEERKELEQLAKQLYRDHGPILDFIFEHGKATDFSQACEAVFGEDLSNGEIIEVDGHGFVFHRSNPRQFSFLPLTWFEAFGDGESNWPGCETWWLGKPVIMWIQLIGNDGKKGKIQLVAEVGPVEDHQARRELITAIEGLKTDNGKLRISFQRGAADEGRRYSKFFKNNILPIEDVQNQDNIADAIKRVLEKFRPEIAAVSETLSLFAARNDYGRPETR